MKKLQKNFTSQEHSKRLLELGVPADSADMYYQNALPEPKVISAGRMYQEYTDSITGLDREIWYFKPCWSVGRLVEIYHICVSGGFSFNVCFPNLMNEVMYRLTEANNNGWLDLKKLEEYGLQ